MEPHHLMQFSVIPMTSFFYLCESYLFAGILSLTDRCIKFDQLANIELQWQIYFIEMKDFTFKSWALKTQKHTISSSSCPTISTDIPDPFSTLFPIVHCFRLVFRATSHIGTELYAGSSWASCLCSSMCRGPPEYITSPAVSRMSDSSNFDNFRDGWQVVVQLLLCSPPGLVQYCSRHSCVFAVKFFLHTYC